jgi:ABC-type multidrug transport system fused ATPase/permease subunit
VASLKKAFLLLSLPERRWAVLYIALLLGVSASEFLSLSLIFPYISLIVNPDFIHSNDKIQKIYNWMAPNSISSFQIQLGLILIGIFILKTCYSFFVNRGLIFFVKRYENHLLSRLLKVYLQKPYPFFIQHPPSELYHMLVGESPYAAHYVYNFLTLISEVALVSAILALFVFVSFQSTLILTLCVVTIFTLNYLFSNKILTRLSHEREFFGLKRGRTTLQNFNGIKDVKVFNNEAFFLNQFKTFNSGLLLTDAKFDTMKSTLFRLVELLSVTSILIILIFSVYSGVSSIAIIPTIAVFAAGAFRMLPSVLKILTTLAQLKYLSNAVNRVFSVFSTDHLSATTEGAPLLSAKRNDRIKFSHSIDINILSFSYPSRPEPILKDVHIEVLKNQSVGIIGESGSGKTTLVDILLGMNVLQNGRIIVDNNVAIERQMEKFRNTIGYVPQRVFLFDTSIAHNIAFGVPESEVDVVRIREVLKIAQLDQFVDSLAEGLDTIVGEFGVKLSGGQIQRVGIARALYHDPEILVLDEATSSLDAQTELDFMNSIRLMMGKKTIFIIAHRMTTVKDCDVIYLLDGGKIAAQGSFEELIEKSENFNNLVARQISK